MTITLQPVAVGATKPTRTVATRSRTKTAKRVGVGLLATFVVVAVALVLYIAVSARTTESEITVLASKVEAIAEENPSVAFDPVAVSELPEPVQRYFDYTFVEAPDALAYVNVEMAGEFRRPLTERFTDTTAEQTIAIGIPSLLFSARTSMAPGVWARAYDFYADGEMEMKAKVMSTLTVVDETATPELNETSLQRWLLESPMYPAALLPGGPVRWEAIDADHARAVVSVDGMQASLVATFRQDGSLASLAAEEDGDLTTPYHGSGEHVARSGDRLVDGMMIPHRFTISRAADGEVYPFWTGEIESISFTSAS